MIGAGARCDPRNTCRGGDHLTKSAKRRRGAGHRTTLPTVDAENIGLEESIVGESPGAGADMVVRVRKRRKAGSRAVPQRRSKRLEGSRP